MFSGAIEKLVKTFLKLPGIGQRTAKRFVFFILKENLVDEFLENLKNLKEKIKFCSFCFLPFEGKDDNLCAICKDPTRDRRTICVVEKETDLEAIEKAKIFSGLFFVLGGKISSLEKKEIEKLRISELIERIKNPKKFGLLDAKIKEVILAFSQTVEGETTTLFLKEKLKNLGVKITFLARGLPTGGELEYADEETLKGAFERRK